MALPVNLLSNAISVPNEKAKSVIFIKSTNSDVQQGSLKAALKDIVLPAGDHWKCHW